MNQLVKMETAEEQGMSADLLAWVEELTTWGRINLSAWDTRARTAVREHPLAVLLGAAAFGVLAGRVLSRR